MKRWHATRASGTVQELEAALQKIETNNQGTIVSVLPGPGPYETWIIVWYEQSLGDDDAGRMTVAK